MDAPVPLILVALLAAAALVAPTARRRAAAMLGALAIAPVILIFHISHSDQFQALLDRPAVAGAAGAAGLVVVAALAVIVYRWPSTLPVLAVAALPFRVPIAVGGATANLLVPLYAVVAAGVLAYALPRLRADDGEPARRSRSTAPMGQARWWGKPGGPPPSTAPAGRSSLWGKPGGPRAGALEWALAAYLGLYAVQAAYSVDFDRALENVVFFYVPFALLFVLVSRVAWTPRLTRACIAVLVGLALVLAGIGFVEYATRHLFLNPKVIASNQLQDYFRVNSLFFDPNIYGRFLALVMVLLVAWLLWARRARDAAAGAVVLAVLWGGLVLTLSQSSFASLLVGLAVLGGMRWSVRRAVALAAGVIAIGAAVVLLAPAALRLDLGSSESADAATSGRYELISGGIGLFAERPLAGWGSGAFPRQYRRAEHVSAERATSASHTIPVTVAAEQGALGLVAYFALLACALGRLFRGAVRGPAGTGPMARWPSRAAVAAAFAALLAHTMLYAAFLEDPMTWTLLAVGTALGVAAGRARETVVAAPEPVAREPAPAPA